MAASSDDKSLALYCDFENIALGVRDAKYQKFDISHILERLLVKGSIVVKKAYCDWDRYKNFKGQMHEAAFELIEIPHVRMSGKNSADIRMVVDALDLCYTKSHVDTFVIISGDSDFSPLVSKLRENAKTVIGVGVKNSTSDLLISSCDEFIYYDDLVREIERGRSPTGRKRSGRKRSPRSTRTEVKVEERDEKEAPHAPPSADGAGRSSRPAADRAEGGTSDEASEPAGEVTMTLEEAAGSRAPVPAPGESVDATVADEVDSNGTRPGENGGGEGGGSGGTGRRSSGRGRSRARRAVASEDESVGAGEGDRSGDSDVTDAATGDVAEVRLDEATDGTPVEPSDEADTASRSKKKTAKRASRKKTATKKVAAKKKSSKKVVSAKAEDSAAASAITADPVAVPQEDDEPTLDGDGDEDDEDDESASETPEELAQEGLDIVLETALALTSERGGSDKLWGSMIKQTLKRRRPGFNESYYGFESFGKMLEEAEARGYLSLEHDDRSGGYIITKISA